ncbi:retrograde regulation protein 2 [Knufia peltigerae]|uniref:Retrograde regulation protein 2 n=1 Tax=Knufia peltigerae TaxID=1002370 RepID=A0AA39CW24_9EURO|nr:retrograde regulation protein 2 [Knufia peltigerae]
MSLRTLEPSSLYGLVDMGSNGIRFSITNLDSSTARCLPTIYTDREGISLYDAQYSRGGSKGPIPPEVIDDVVRSLLKFKTVCADFAVPETNIRILATEATRNAVNSEDFRRQIKDATGWEVDMLPKEAEGKIGAMGVASSFSEVEGLVMDLGGGSTQITWMVSRNGTVETSPRGSISFPYGAAAMTRLLSEISQSKQNTSGSTSPLNLSLNSLNLFKFKSSPTSSASASEPSLPNSKEDLEQTMISQFRQAYADLYADMPETLRYKAKHGGLTLYLSGGGFRGWGYLLMSQHKVSPYPIPIINGFSVRKREFQQTREISVVAAEESVFRISKRRAAQVPAVALLVNVLVEAVPVVSNVRFCQGGVREGFLFDTLSRDIRAQDPLVAATQQFAGPNAEEIGDMLFNAIPGENNLDREVPRTIGRALARAVADLMFLGTIIGNKESRGMGALCLPITGVLSGAHGLSHSQRAVLSLALCARWGGDLPPPYDDLERRLKGLLKNQEIWWATYLGRVAALVGSLYPAGRIGAKRRLKLKAYWADGLGKKGLAQGVVLEVKCLKDDVLTEPAILNPMIDEIEKLGKKKNKAGGEHGFGVPVDIRVERVLSVTSV